MSQSKARERMLKRIRNHGESLLRLFPNTAEKDPVKLCRMLRRIEVRANNRACDLCNGSIETEAYARAADKDAMRANDILGSDRVWINNDPRGYALKINLMEGEDLYRDWGGYGIIAPDLT